MKQFSTFANQPTTDKLLHITHLEDVLFEGQNGLALITDIFYELLTALRFDITYTKKFPGSLNLSLKYDGAPALVFGRDPTDNLFFLGTKSVFNRYKPKIAKNHSDIDRFYKDSLANLLHESFNVLNVPEFPPVVVQGDFLFLPEDVVEDEHTYAFQPNVIQYVVSKTNSAGQIMPETRLGLAIHTQYVGNALETRQAVPITADALLALKFTLPQVWLPTTQIWLPFTGSQNIPSLSATAVVELGTGFTMVEGISLSPAVMKFMSDHAGLVRIFINDTIRRNEYQEHCTAPDFIVKANRTLQPAALAELNQMRASADIDVWFAAYRKVVAFKNALLYALFDACDREDESILTMGTFFVGNDGELEPTTHEGFVVAYGGHTVKLVDRERFSRHNFLHSQFLNKQTQP